MGPTQASGGIGLAEHFYDGPRVLDVHRRQLSGTLYIGMTNNIERRMWEHKSGKFEGFASEYKCGRLVYLEGFDDVRKAIDREKQLKGWRRSKKIALIQSRNPRWEDLAEKWGWRMAFAGESIKGR